MGDEMVTCPRCGGHGVNVGHPAMDKCCLCNGFGDVSISVLRDWMEDHARITR